MLFKIELQTMYTQILRAGYMPIMVKDPKYLKDPKLFNPIRPRMPHSYD